MDIITLELQRRDDRGTSAAGRMRRSGRIPGVVYGRKTEALAISIDTHTMTQVIRTTGRGNVLFDLKIPGESGEVKAILREVQRDPVRSGLLHCDFQRIILTEKITVRVAVHAKGIADGVKNFGGILDHHLRELEIRCLPTDVPASIYVDVTHLGIGDSLRVKEVVHENIEILDDPDSVVISVVPPTVLKEATAATAEGAAAEAPAEPEVIKKKKAEEGEEEEKKKEGGKEEKKEKGR